MTRTHIELLTIVEAKAVDSYLFSLYFSILQIVDSVCLKGS